MSDAAGLSLEERGLTAARAVAVAHGIACDDAYVLPTGTNVLVHLAPAPVIARVMTATAPLHDDVEGWLRREVAVGTFLAERGLAVPPSDRLAPGPYEHGGLWMTCWQLVDIDPSGPEPDARRLGGSLRDLHDALADFRGELGPLSDIRDWLRDLTGDDGLRSRLEALTPTVFESPLPTQPIHGDASTANLLRTADRLLWNDLEDVCVGPVRWDVAGFVVEAREVGRGEAFVSDFLRAYGGVNLEELEPFIEADRLYTTIWQATRISAR